MDVANHQEVSISAPRRRLGRIGPALTLVALAPLVAEVLPGATRLGSLFVFPIEMCVWGGGALMIRFAVRRARLGWLNMLCLAVALAIAEECLIQQTSLAPMFLKLKGQEYARAFGVNYVYFLWALVYEAVFVVMVPVHLAELIFPDRREETWISRAGLVTTAVFFVIGCYFAWLSWTQFARPHAFHVPVYTPPPGELLAAAAAIGVLIYLALGPYADILAKAWKPLKAPPPWLLGFAGGVWATLWYGLVVLALGVAPSVPPAAPVGTGLFLVALILLFLPRWVADPRWNVRHQYALIFGVMLGSMLVSFIGFIGAWPPDLYFKIVVDVIAVGLMAALGVRRLARQGRSMSEKQSPEGKEFERA